jgi:hypothetical protein
VIAGIVVAGITDGTWRGDILYRENKARDADHDRIACQKR